MCYRVELFVLREGEPLVRGLPAERRERRYDFRDHGQGTICPHLEQKRIQYFSFSGRSNATVKQSSSPNGSGCTRRAASGRTFVSITRRGLFLTTTPHTAFS